AAQRASIAGCEREFQAAAREFRSITDAAHSQPDVAREKSETLVRDFLGAPPEMTEGHQEVKIALMRLYQVTGHAPYLDLAQHFIEARGRIRHFALHIYRQNRSHEARKALVAQRRAAYAAAHPQYAVSKVPPGNAAKMPPFAKRRWDLSALSGKYNQQHAPVRQQTVPVGHAVRYGYFQTATAMLHRLRGDPTLLPALEKSWQHMVTRRMYVTGGLGALPAIEGFGNDYELDPEMAYAETCAALASLFWNWEMALITAQPQYSDLFEWQLYNAALVGMGISGNTYLYNNPLCVHGGITRRGWYAVPCCPSNLSRTLAWLGKYIYSFDENNVWIHQYIGSAATLAATPTLSLTLESTLPFAGDVTLRLNPPATAQFSLHLRLPSWAEPHREDIPIHLNGQPISPTCITLPPRQLEATAQGYDPRLAGFATLDRIWQPGDVLTLTLPQPILLRRAHPKVKGHRGKATLTRGPLVYCLESVDNPGVDIFHAVLDPATLATRFDPQLLGGTLTLTAQTREGHPLTFIPYALWGNRGESQMNVWVNAL
ncbi:MAG: beta-L-arabinofuranosidase domain-containing protein, partial [Anaerolineales bacterium]